MVPTLGYQWTHATGLFACISRAFRAFFAVFPASLPIDFFCVDNTNHERKRNEAGSCVILCSNGSAIHSINSTPCVHIIGEGLSNTTP